VGGVFVYLFIWGAMALLSFVSGYTLMRTLRQQQTASRDGNLSFRASTRAHHQTVKRSYGGGGGSSKLFLQCSLASSFGRLAPSSLFSTIDSSGSAGNKLSLLHIRSHTETSEAAAAPETTTSREACPAIKPEIQFSAFEAVDIRVGLITDAKAVNDEEMSAKRGKPTLSRKFLQLTVDIGCETRVVVSECKYVMDVEDAVGRKVLFVANVPPTEILGLHSHGVFYNPTCFCTLDEQFVLVILKYESFLQDCISRMKMLC
jgi:tRNA-binding EMAP/Myf-like protein